MQTQRQRRSISDLKQIICSALPDRQAKLLRKDFAALLVIRITGGKRKILQKNKRRECRKDAEMTMTVVQDVFGSLKILLYNYEVEKKIIFKITATYENVAYICIQPHLL